jgi:DNA-binding HxlR family transcriptional regulator
VTKRTYDQFCGLARALDLVGERWTLLIVRDLALGPQRYSDLLAGLPGIGSGLLAERLKRLEEAGIVRKGHLPPPANVSVYELTDDGRSLHEAMVPLAVWGARHLDVPDGDLLFRADWMLVTIGSLFDPERAKGVRESYEFHIDDEVIHVRVDDGRLETRRGPAPGGADLVVASDPQTFIDVGVGRLAVADAVAQGRGTILSGSAEALQRCVEILAGRVAAAGESAA